MPRRLSLLRTNPAFGTRAHQIKLAMHPIDLDVCLARHAHRKVQLARAHKATVQKVARLHIANANLQGGFEARPAAHGRA